MSNTFCGVCRHPSPGHEPGCPVSTGEPQAGMPAMQQPQDQNLPPNSFSSFGMPQIWPQVGPQINSETDALIQESSSERALKQEIVRQRTAIGILEAAAQRDIKLIRKLANLLERIPAMPHWNEETAQWFSNQRDALVCEAREVTKE